MRLLALSGVLALLVLAGCSNDSLPGSVLQPDSAARSTTAENQGLFLGKIVGTATTTGYCAPYTLQIHIVGSGPLSFLGETQFDGTICSVWTDNIPPFEGTMTGDGTAVAANGDIVYMTMEGTYYAQNPPPTTLRITATYTVTGGTGRFAAASGSGTLYGEEDLQNLLGSHAAWFQFNGGLLF